jgi:acetyl-CoA decarbonylase/synthase complex subunit gamma
VPRVSGTLSADDRLGAVKVRVGIGRMQYMVDPGLYALGNAAADSPVLVTANYKFSFDKLRAAFNGRSAWILVLDTEGINVWCAAGKRTFGTNELVRRIKSSGLEKIVSGRNLVLPQLSAPGIAAHTVKRASGFSVVYGPVQAGDLPAFMDAGMKATPAMRTKQFPVSERAVLIPMEFIPALKYGAVLLPLLFLLGGVGYPGGYWENAASHGLLAVLLIGGGLIAGTVFTPILLPWLPGRAFAAKGAFAGLITAGLLWLFIPAGTFSAGYNMEFLSLTLIATAFSGFLGMNFTGASTYTSLSGVRREMRWAVPLEIAVALLGLILWIGTRFF